MKFRRIKRTLSLVLSAILIAGTSPVYAEESVDNTEIVVEGETASEEIEIPEDLETPEDSDITEDTEEPEEEIQEDPVIEDEDTPADSVETPDQEKPEEEEEIEVEVENPEDQVQIEAAGASATSITLEEHHYVTVLAKGYSFPSTLKNVKVAVWSNENGKDDLKWYKMVKTSAGYKVRINLFDHADKDDIFYFRLYYVTADNKKTLFSKSDLKTEDVFTTKVEAEETKDSYKVSLFNPTEEPKKVEFAIWSREGGQDDLKWYTGTYDTENRRADFDWTLTGLKHFGTVFIHCYVTDSTGKRVYQAAKQLEISQPEIGSVKAVYNAATGAYKITLSDVKNAAGISKIQIPVWSDSKQADIVWHQASQKSDGTWTVSSNVSAHGYRSGTYHVHVYVTDKLGVRKFSCNTSFQVEGTEKTSKTEEKVSGSGICEIRAINYKELNTGKSVRVAFWSAEGGQDDLKWYSLTKKEEVSGDKTDVVWYAKIDLNKHGGANGTYYAHVYYNTTDGKPVCVSTYSFQVNDLFKTNLTATKNNGSYKIVLSNPTVTPQAVRFAIWSRENGQDDLKWFDGTYNSTTREAALTWKGENLKHYGTVYIHAYVIDTKGSYIFQKSTEVNMTQEAISIAEKQASFTRSTGAFTIKVSGVTGLARKITAAVWSDSKQADLNWYSLTASDSGVWSYTGNISKHGYRTGKYHVHFYVTDDSGQQKYTDATSFTASLPGNLEIRTVHENHTYQAAVTGLSSKYTKSVSVAVWSQENGQDDLVWYNAILSGNEYVVNIPIAKHGDLGNYFAHAYVTRTDGTQYNNEYLCSSFNVNDGITTEYSYLDRQTDNGTFVVALQVYAYQKTKSVSFTVWTEKNGSDDQEVISAEEQSDGSWAAVVNPSKHGYETGVYRIIGSLLMEDNTSCILEEATYTVSESTSFYTVVDSEKQATILVQGYSDAADVKIYVWSVNGGQDDIKCYQAEKTETGWKKVVYKSNHGSAGKYTAHLYVNGKYALADYFSFDENRYADSWDSISTAHGGGGQGENKNERYTNCLTAMNNSYKQGYRTFEIDVLLTKDGEPVLYHTWSTNILDKYRYSSATSDGPTYKQFMSDTMYGGKYATSDFRDLLTYLMEHPDVKVLLDTKYRSAADMQSLYRKLLSVANSMGAGGAFRNQIIPYVFYTDHLSALRSVCAFKEYHYATYAAYYNDIGTFAKADFKVLLQYCKANRILSISMWDCLATGSLIKMADAMGINVYVHTTDDPATAQRLLKLGAAGIISNSITPVQAVGFLS